MWGSAGARVARTRAGKTLGSLRCGSAALFGPVHGSTAYISRAPPSTARICQRFEVEAACGGAHLLSNGRWWRYTRGQSGCGVRRTAWRRFSEKVAVGMPEDRIARGVKQN